MAAPRPISKTGVKKSAQWIANDKARAAGKRPSYGPAPGAAPAAPPAAPQGPSFEEFLTQSFADAPQAPQGHSVEEIAGLAKQQAMNVINAQIAALPTEDAIRGMYQNVGQDIASLNAAYAQHLGGQQGQAIASPMQAWDAHEIGMRESGALASRAKALHTINANTSALVDQYSNDLATQDNQAFTSYQGAFDNWQGHALDLYKARNEFDLGHEKNVVTAKYNQGKLQNGADRNLVLAGQLGVSQQNATTNKTRVQNEKTAAQQRNAVALRKMDAQIKHWKSQLDAYNKRSAQMATSAAAKAKSKGAAKTLADLQKARTALVTQAASLHTGKAGTAPDGTFRLWVTVLDPTTNRPQQRQVTANAQNRNNPQALATLAGVPFDPAHPPLVDRVVPNTVTQPASPMDYQQAYKQLLGALKARVPTIDPVKARAIVQGIMQPYWGDAALTKVH